jgi:sirohydrochlorin ferrochelatase
VAPIPPPQPEDAKSALAILLYNDTERERAEQIIHRMVKRAVEMEGTVTGEHGVGLVKRDYLNHELGESTVDTMRKVSSRSAGPSTAAWLTDDDAAETGPRSIVPLELRQGRTGREARRRGGGGLVGR